MEKLPQHPRLCFGGSFNPIHHGHLICARAVAESRGFEKVVLIPSRQPPHKKGASDLASPQDRLEMCRLATAGSAMFEVDDIELKREGPSYTIATARELRRRGWGRMNCLIGLDMLAILPQWHEPAALLEEVNFIIMGRPGCSFDWNALPFEFQKLRANVAEAPLIDISATGIRARVKKGLSIEYLVPEAVGDHIRKMKLYR